MSGSKKMSQIFSLSEDLPDLEKQFVINADLIAIHQIIDSISYFCEVQYHTSIYSGVCWNSNSKKWQTMLMYKKKIYYGGLFENEEHAAMKINLLCDKLKIKRKNPMVNIELFDDHQVTNSFFKIFTFHTFSIFLKFFYFS